MRSDPKAGVLQALGSQPSINLVSGETTNVKSLSQSMQGSRGRPCQA